MGGGFEAMRKAAAGGEERDREDEARRNADFNYRVQIQQLLNTVAPIFKVYARGGMPAEHLIEGTGLRDHAEAARRLAVSVVACLTDTMPDAVDPVLVRVLMQPMAEFVAHKIEAEIPVDVSADTAAIVSAIKLVDPKYDINPFEHNPVSKDVTLEMTAAAGMSLIVAQLAWYDFRTADVAAVAARLIDAVMVKSAAVVMRVAADRPERDRMSLMQSFVKHHSEIMANAVANRSAAALEALRDLDAVGRDAWRRDHDPVGESVARFEVLAKCLEATQLTCVAAMKDPAAFLSDHPSSMPGSK